MALCKYLLTYLLTYCVLILIYDDRRHVELISGSAVGITGHGQSDQVYNCLKLHVPDRCRRGAGAPHTVQTPPRIDAYYGLDGC